jgi:hypothetical protein
MAGQKVQHILSVFLAEQGHDVPAQEALHAETRLEWERLADLAIRTAPESKRTEVAQAIKYALDLPENGGPGLAADYLLRRVAHPLQPGQFLYRAYRVYKLRDPEFIELVSPDVETLKRRVVGSHVVRNFFVEY